MILDVFNISLERIDNISEYTYASYTKVFNGAGEFQVSAQLNDTMRNTLENGEFILLDKNTCGRITLISSTVDEETNNFEIVLKGYLLNSLLATRCIPLVKNYSDTVTNIVRDLVYTNFTAPSDSKRTMPVRLSTAPEYIPSSTRVTTQMTGGSVQNRIEELLDSENMGYDIVPVLSTTQITGFEFRVLKGVDRSISNTSGNSPVVFSRSLKNILKNSYSKNLNEYKNMAYVAGEGKGAERTVVSTGSVAATGFNRSELYVDARDLSSTDGETTLTTEEYQQVLSRRGLEKLEECKKEEACNASIDTIGTQFTYGEDYFLGDLVTVQDQSLGLSLNARVTQVQLTSTGEKNLVDIVFGNYKLSTLKRLKRNEVL